MTRLLNYLLVLICTCCINNTFGQDKSNRGKEFWLAYGFDYTFFNETPVNSQELAIYISTELQAANVTITITNTGYTQTLAIPANTVNASIIIPKSGANDARTLTDGLQTRNIHIESDVPVAVYAHVYASQVSGATMLMPVETYGYVYHSINYYQTTSQSSPSDWYSWFYVIASENNTRVEITPSDTTKNGWLPGQTYTVNLNKGESYHVFGKAVFNGNPAFASKDMTGSKIVSIPGGDGNCHPVALFSGSGGIRLCRGDGGEFMHQQVFPAQAWGTRYLTYHTINNANTDILETNRNYYRVCVQDPSTIVKKNGIVMAGLIKNFFYEYMDSTGGDYITADKPILVSQYTPNKNQCWNFPTTSPSPPSYGDPEMFYLSPIEQGQKSVLFYTSRKSTIDYVYANIHVPTNAVGSLRVDGVALSPSQIIPHPNYPSYSVALARFIGVAAQHTITCDSAFTSTVYGLGNFESYGYNVGTLINNLNNYSAIQNTQNTSGIVDTFSCPKTPLRVFVKLGFPANAITWKLSQVNGITPNTDSVITNPIPIRTEEINGRTYYVYTLQQDFTFANQGTYYIPVSYAAAVIQNCSQTENAIVKVVVKAGPIADFSFTGTGCAKDSVYFTGNVNATGFTINQYLWNFADNTTANTINTVKKFTNAATQNVRFRIYANNGCAADTTKPISFIGNPVAKFGFDKNICIGDSIKFSDSSTTAQGTITSWNWFFGDGNSSVKNSNTPFYYKYSLAGNYIVKLIVTSSAGCISDTFSLPVSVSHKPNAKFGILNNNICLGDSIRITDSSSISQGNITTWNWNFGDGNSVVRNNNNPFFYKYSASGSYVVSLIVSPSNGCISDTFKLTVTVGVKPVAKFGISLNNICARDSVLITDSSTVASGNIAAWNWNFGDGTSLVRNNNNSFYHSYQLPGTYTISLITVPALGCVSDTFKITLTVNQKPSARFSYDKNICVNDSIKFSDSSTITQGSIINRKWDFGDGTIVNTTTNTPLFHQYTSAGTFTVKLIVFPNTGCTDTFNLNVQVNQKPIATFTINGKPCIDSSFTFTSGITSSTGNTATWYWNFGDGQIFSSTANHIATHSYSTQVTNVNIKHLVSYGIGCTSDTATNTIPLISTNPTASFSIIGDTLCENKLLSFVANTSGIITDWTWNLGGFISNAASPINYGYTNSGNYSNTLIVKNAAGCNSVPFNKPISIAPIPNINAGTDKVILSGSSVTLDATINNSLNYNFTWTPIQYLSSANVLNPIATPPIGSYVFAIKAVDKTNFCMNTDSVKVTVVNQLKIPNAFSPNGDGINDKWNIQGLELYPDATVSIFTRYGQKVYEARNYSSKPWDGTNKGKKLPVGAYAYVIVLTEHGKENIGGMLLLLQ